MTNDLGEEPTEEDTVLAILKTFYNEDKRSWTVCVNEFNKLVSKDHKPVKLNLDFDNNPAEYFIIADLYLSRLDLVSLYNHLSGNVLKDISVSLAKRVKNDYLKSVEYLKDKYEWIYNPPSLPGVKKQTIGKQLRMEFQEHYGAYAEITYLIACGDVMKFNQVNQMKLSTYLALGEYLLRKRTIENID